MELFVQKQLPVSPPTVFSGWRSVHQRRLSFHSTHPTKLLEHMPPGTPVPAEAIRAGAQYFQITRVLSPLRTSVIHCALALCIPRWCVFRCYSHLPKPAAPQSTQIHCRRIHSWTQGPTHRCMFHPRSTALGAYTPLHLRTYGISVLHLVHVLALPFHYPCPHGSSTLGG